MIKQVNDYIKQYNPNAEGFAQFECAVLAGVPDAVYHALPRRFISKHDLDVFCKCPSTYDAMKSGALGDATETPSIIFGRAFHAAVLQPKEYEAQFAVAPQVDRRTKAGKAEYEAFAEANAGKTILTLDQWEEIEKMRERVVAATGDLFRDKRGHAELVLTHPWSLFDETFIRGKLDWLVLDEENKEATIVDLKTTSDASARAFKLDAVKYAYHVQAAIYRWLVVARFGDEWRVKFRFVCVEKGGNNPVAQYELSEEFENAGLNDFFATARSLREAMANGVFPDYNGGEITTVDTPTWLFRSE